MHRTLHRAALPLAAAALLLTGCVGEPSDGPEDSGNAEPVAGVEYPVTLTSCGQRIEVARQPTQAITLNQGATEVVLALGLSDQLAGTAYLDDEIPARWRDAYDEVPVLSAEYPTTEELLAAGPDFVYASYASAFEPKVAGSQQDLADDGVGSYLSPYGCSDEGDRPEPSFDAVWQEVADVAEAFGHPERAEQLQVDQQQTLDELAEERAGDGVDLLWWDGGTKAPSVGAGDGGPQLVMDAVGATNIFGDLAGNWADGNWEDVLKADPDAIVLIDASWDPAKDKRAYLEQDPVLSQLSAVESGSFVVIPFSESTPGVRLVDGATALGEQLDDLGSAR